jgi:transcriptional regulator GlxA family with amidase domain
MTMTPAEATNRRLLRTRDAIDRDFDQPLDVPALARIAYVSPAHFSRTFRTTFGESPHRYLQRRRIERAMAMLRNTDLGVTEVALAVGFSSHGTFSRTFRDIVGDSPSGYRRDAISLPGSVCFQKAWLRPSSFGEAPALVRGLA